MIAGRMLCPNKILLDPRYIIRSSCLRSLFLPVDSVVEVWRSDISSPALIVYLRECPGIDSIRQNEKPHCLKVISFRVRPPSECGSGICPGPDLQSRLRADHLDGSRPWSTGSGSCQCLSFPGPGKQLGQLRPDSVTVNVTARRRLR